MVQFDRRLASSMGRDRTWLAGDATHLSSPVGVQSMNTGLVDGFELSSALVSILRENGSPELLQRYEQSRLEEIGPLFGEQAGPRPTADAADWAKSLARHVVPTVPATAGDLEQLLAQIGLEFKAPTSSSI
jgi:2-polyprenyl-6-methoxyphenol hydroxylase-like FAD-dependent oxidoreductase